MTTRAMRSIVGLPFAVLLCAAVGLLGGCNRGGEAPKPAATAARPAPQAAAPAAPAPFAVTRIDLGTSVGADKKVATPQTTFKPGDTIYASVLSSGAAPSVTVATKWTYEDGQTVNESSQTIAPTGPAVTEFHISKPDGWPAGKYKLVVMAGGKPAGAVDFTVAE